MNVNVHSIHFDADTKLVTFIKEKLGKLTQFHDSIISAEVFLRLEHDGDNRENKVVDIRLAVPGREHFAKRQGKSFEEATSGTVEALRSQVERTKERLRKAS
ncbi:MAG: HPF/RaiA family ribosome-associated protein [Flavobacteriales bacterium]